jgi:hypothetical protein
MTWKVCFGSGTGLFSVLSARSSIRVAMAAIAVPLLVAKMCFAQTSTDTATIPVGNLSLANIDTVVLQGPESPFKLAPAIQPYNDGSTYSVHRPVPLPQHGDVHGTASTLQILNQGATVAATNMKHVNLLFTVSGWNTAPANATVQFTVGSQTKTVNSGTSEVIFPDVPHSSLSLSIAANGVETSNGHPVPVAVPGLLPIRVICPLAGTLHPSYDLLTILYAPPGTNGGHATSSVDYGSGSSAGMTTSASSAFGTNIDVKAELSGGFFGGSTTVSADFGAAVDSTDRSLEFCRFWALRRTESIMTTTSSSCGLTPSLTYRWMSGQPRPNGRSM